MKVAIIFLALLGACAWPLEEHGGAAPKPAPPDAVFYATGAAADAALQLAGVPWPARLIAIPTLAFAVRMTPCCGRPEASHLLIIMGAVPIEALGIVVRGHP